MAIYLMDADRGNKRRLVEGREPAWSPAGRRVAFTSSAFEGNDEIYLIDVDGSGMRRLTEHKKIDQQPAWSPDSRGLAYSGKMKIGEDGEFVTDERGRSRGTFDIYLLPAAGFDGDDTTERPVVPVNLTRTDDRDERSPSWRAF